MEIFLLVVVYSFLIIHAHYLNRLNIELHYITMIVNNCLVDKTESFVVNIKLTRSCGNQLKHLREVQWIRLTRNNNLSSHKDNQATRILT